MISVFRARQCKNVCPQSQKQNKQKRHHHLVGFLNSTCNAKCHDNRSHKNCDHQPAIVAKAGSSTIKQSANGFHILSQGIQVATECQKRILKDPTNHHGITNGQRHGAQNRDHANQLPCPFLSSAKLRTHAKGFDRTTLGHAPQRHLLDHSGRRDQHHKHQIGKQKCHSSPV